VGFWLAGLVIGVTAVSYALNMTFRYQFLVLVIGIAFAAVALLALEWPRALRGPAGEVPRGGLRQFLVVAIPLAFVLDSQICGLGLKACSVVCNVISVALIGLGVVIAYRLYRDQPIGALLVPMVILGLVPHCVCEAPINTIWHAILGGYAPTCQVMPLVAMLFSIAALRGRRTLLSAALVALMLVVIAFIAVGNPLFGFPWRGCVG
jgi:hypothetical protein